MSSRRSKDSGVCVVHGVMKPCEQCRSIATEIAPTLAPSAALRARVAELEKLAYIGEHHFPDLTWKARCEEAAKRVSELEADREHWRGVAQQTSDSYHALRGELAEASKLTERVADLERDRNAQSERAAVAEAEVARLVQAHDAGVPVMRELHARVAELEKQLASAAGSRDFTDRLNDELRACAERVGQQRDATEKRAGELEGAIKRLSEWPESTPEHPSITSQDIAMRAFARAALAGGKGAGHESAETSTKKESTK